MFRKKIIWLALLSILPISLTAIASNAQMLIDRAHYWNKLGRSDLAQLAWQELLVLEPGNAEARVAIAQDQTRTLSESSKPTAGESTTDIRVSESVRTVADYAPHGLTALAIKNESEVAEPGGSLVASDNPSRQELLERAKYWDSRGRADLAAKVRNQYKLGDTKQPDKAVNAPSLSDDGASNNHQQNIARREAAISTEPNADAALVWLNQPPEKRALPSESPGQSAQNTSEMVPAKPSSQQLNERAQYWENRGRSDLADQARNSGKSSESGVITAPVLVTPVVSAIRPVTPTTTDVPGMDRGRENTQMLAVAPPTRQELNDNAQYWESRGRSDLAEQIRQKVQMMESAQASSSSARAGRGTAPGKSEYAEKTIINQYVEKTSLEDELLKNHNSLKARLDLAQIYRSAGEMAKARVLIEGVLISHPDLPEALYASAALYAEQRLWPETLHVLEKISPVSRTAEMAKLQKIAWAHAQIDRADALVRQGNSAEAEVLLRQVAAELAVNFNRMHLPEPPPLWKSTTGVVKMKR